jgi:hypothetical protein
VILNSLEEIILFLLEEGECLSVFVEASLNAAAFFGCERGTTLEVDA